jgi:hypothetical protein
MLIKCEIAGNLIINDLREFKITGGQVVDLSKIFSEQDIKNSMRAPDGGLYRAASANQINIIHQNSSDYKKYLECIRKEVELEKKSKIREEERTLRLRFFRMPVNKAIDFIAELDYFHYDFLLNLRASEEREPLIEAINNRLKDFSEYRIADGFVLL